MLIETNKNFIKNLIDHINNNHLITEIEKNSLIIEYKNVFLLEEVDLTQTKQYYSLLHKQELSNEECCFIFCCDVGNLAITQYYLSYITHINIHMLDNYPINIACTNGHVEVVKCILDFCQKKDESFYEKFSLEFFNKKAYHCFKYIACRGHNKMIEFLTKNCTIDTEKVIETIEEAAYVCHCKYNPNTYKTFSDIIYHIIMKNDHINERIVHQKLSENLLYDYDIASDNIEDHVAGRLLTFAIELCSLKMHNQLDYALDKKTQIGIQKNKI